jgi:GNAT superfamily N-acetyltransferase
VTPQPGVPFSVRPVGATDWRKMKALRLSALADPAAPIAFIDTLEQAAARPDTHWQERALLLDGGVDARQFIAEKPDGAWIGNVVALLERPGTFDFLATAVEEPQVHLVGVYVAADHRGAGVADALFEAAIGWAWSHEEPRVTCARLFVHEHNLRAQAFYRRIGFVPSGRTVALPGEPPAEEREFVLRRT